MPTRLILTAAGKGERLGLSIPKALVPITENLPLAVYTLRRFLGIPLGSPVVITIPPNARERFAAAFAGFDWPWEIRFVPGGDTRQESVHLALEALPGDTDIACVHVAARPFIEPAVIEACIDAARAYGAATTAIPAVDTILEADPDRCLAATPDRARLWQCQTPQCFRFHLFRDAHRQARREHRLVTDDATLARLAGHPVRLVPGTPENFKVTTPADLRLARLLAGASEGSIPMLRTGIGWDLHRLEPGLPFILGGVRIPHDRGAVAHSDGDTLTHAIIDALLGAAGLGNIGMLYPDTDPRFQNADSMILLRDTLARVREANWLPVNVDAVVIAQRPRLNPHVEAMRRNLADALNLPVEAVSVKPKTAEGTGPEGREEAVSAQVIVLLRQNGPAA